MTAVASPAVGTPAVPDRAGGRGPWLLVALHLPFVASGPVLAIPRHHLGVGPAALLVLVALAIGGLQLRHSFAAARGERPAAAPWTFLALTALVYLPLWWLTWDWALMQWFVVASGAMVLRGPPAVVATAGPVLGHTLVAAWVVVDEPDIGPGLQAITVVYQFVLLAMGSVALYGSAWLARVLDDLYAARTELAELAVGRERLRVSRDLHDLLGQSLSAVSLKGDLALRLLPTDTAAARAEIESLTGVARDALRDVRAVARNEHAVSLPAEIEAATALLGAAGIATRVRVDLTALPGPVEDALAWAVREGATNALRHSRATTWEVTAGVEDAKVVLTMVNDGAPATREPGPGHGLAGLRQRAGAVSGSLTAGATPEGRFRLVVTVPAGTGPAGSDEEATHG